MGESPEAASSFVEIIAGIDSRAGLHPMSHGLCTLSHVSYATQPRYCRNYALKIYDTRRKRRNAPSVARFSLPITAHTISVTSNDYSPLKVPLRGRGCNLPIVDALAHSLTAWCQACV